MFDLMYAARGVGLAANQVNLPLQLFVINITGSPDSGSELVFINPVLEKPKGKDTAEEGCLSIPGLAAPVCRPEKITINAYDLNGNEIEIVASGLLARAIQHEFDHLNGVLFIDRLSDLDRRQLDHDLSRLAQEHESKQVLGTLPGDPQIIRGLADLEKVYC
jgi:peptide deformylase